MFQTYHKDGPLFIVVNKENTDEKYQFHFESKQFMDKNDHRINTREFLKQKDNKEILAYFFPSIYSKVSEEQIKSELKRIDILPEEIASKIFKRAIGKINNPLIKSLINNNEEELSKIFFDVNKYYYDNGRIIFYTDSLTNDLEQLQLNIGYYEYEVNNGWDHVYNDMRDRDMDEYETERIESFLESYYLKNADSFKETFGTRDFDEFLKTFYDNYIFNKEFDMKESFWSDIADLSYASYEQGNQSIIDSITKDINIESRGTEYDISVSQVKFIQFLLKKNITSISDSEKLMDVLDDYINYCGHSGDFEFFYNNDIVYPKYGEKNDLTKYTDIYFENLLNNGTTT